jgi:hypothetical protein
VRWCHGSCVGARRRLQSDCTSTCKTVLQLLEECLIPYASRPASRINYLKVTRRAEWSPCLGDRPGARRLAGWLAGWLADPCVLDVVATQMTADHHRYLAEMQCGRARKVNTEHALRCYQVRAAPTGGSAPALTFTWCVSSRALLAAGRTETCVGWAATDQPRTDGGRSVRDRPHRVPALLCAVFAVLLAERGLATSTQLTKTPRSTEKNAPQQLLVPPGRGHPGLCARSRRGGGRVRSGTVAVGVGE